MSLEESVGITKENTVNLKEIFNDGDPESTREYELIEACVRCYVFSQFEERRELGIGRLRQLFNPWTQVHIVEEDGFIYTYLSITKKREKFLFVEMYPGRMHLEEAPTGEERERLAYFNATR